MLTDENVAQVQFFINERSRKYRDWVTPAQLFERAGRRLGVALAW